MGLAKIQPLTAAGRAAYLAERRATAEIEWNWL